MHSHGRNQSQRGPGPRYQFLHERARACLRNGIMGRVVPLNVGHASRLAMSCILNIRQNYITWISDVHWAEALTAGSVGSSGAAIGRTLSWLKLTMLGLQGLSEKSRASKWIIVPQQIAQAHNRIQVSHNTIWSECVWTEACPKKTSL